jgi:hypothetical protein
MASFSAKISEMFAYRRFNVIAFCVITLLILLAYSNTFTASFHFDDNPSIVENPFIKRITPEYMLKQLTDTTRPVVGISLMLNYAVSGLNVVGWHIFNTALHIANAIFVYLLLLKTFDLPSLAPRFGGTRARRMALFGALLFGLHPIQTESVTYIISRTELLASFFYLLTFLLFVKVTETGKFRYSLACFFSSLLAMGSKEWAVTLPAMIILYDFMFISDSRIKPLLSRWKTYILIALPWGYMAYALSTVKMQGAGFGVTGQNNITPWSYLLTSLNVEWTYLRLLFFPINQNLDYDYQWSKTLFEFPTLLSLVGHLAVVTACFWLYRKRNWTVVPFGMAWFYITLSPTQSFVPILDVIFEHRLYLPSIGIILAFIVAYECAFDWFDKRKSAAVIVSQS